MTYFSGDRSCDAREGLTSEADGVGKIRAILTFHENRIGADEVRRLDEIILCANMSELQRTREKKQLTRLVPTGTKPRTRVMRAKPMSRLLIAYTRSDDTTERWLR